MRKFWKVLPLFVLEWIAPFFCERVTILDTEWIIAFENVLFRIDED